MVNWLSGGLLKGGKSFGAVKSKTTRGALAVPPVKRSKPANDLVKFVGIPRQRAGERIEVCDGGSKRLGIVGQDAVKPLETHRAQHWSCFDRRTDRPDSV